MGNRKRRSRASGGTRATVALATAGVDYTTWPYEADGTGEPYATEAAIALGVPESVVFKTLVVEVDATAMLACVPADSQLDLKALAHASGGAKAHLAEPHDAERLTGYVVGGISPIGTRRPLPTMIDTSVAELDQVYVSAGKRGLQVRLAPDDLITVTGARLAPIARRR